MHINNTINKLNTIILFTLYSLECETYKRAINITSLGMARLWIKKGKMNCYFVQNQQSAFYSSAIFGNIIINIANPASAGSFKSQGVQVKEKGKYLIMTFSTLYSIFLIYRTKIGNYRKLSIDLNKS